MILDDFAYFKYDSTYNEFATNPGLGISEGTIVFVEDTGNIYARGHQFGGKYEYQGEDGVIVDGNTITLDIDYINENLMPEKTVYTAGNYINISNTNKISVDLESLKDALDNEIRDIPVASATTLGGIKVGYNDGVTSNIAGRNYKVLLDSNNNAFVYVPWTDTKPEDPGIPDDPELGSNPSSNPKVVRLTEDEFNALTEKQQDTLYIIVDSNGNILYMWLNGNKIFLADKTSTQKETGTITLDEFRNMSTEEKKSKNWIILDENGNIIGMALEGVYLPNATESAQVDGVGYKVLIVNASDYNNNNYTQNVLYLLKNSEGKISTAYLNGQQIPLEKVNGMSKSDVTEMFSLNFEKDNQGNITGLKYTGLTVDNPGEFYAITGFKDYILEDVRDAGFISMSDGEESIAEMFAAWENGQIIKKASIIASINSSGESGITINADKINVEGVFLSKTIGEKSVSEILLDANSVVSKVNTIENGYVKVSNINQESGKISLLAICTDANNVAKNVSFDLSVDETTSKIKLTADEIELDGHAIADSLSTARATITNCTIVGDLNFNKIIGKVIHRDISDTTIVGSTTVPECTLFIVRFTDTSILTDRILNLPSEPVDGQMVYIKRTYVSGDTTAMIIRGGEANVNPLEIRIDDSYIHCFIYEEYDNQSSAWTGCWHQLS